MISRWVDNARRGQANRHDEQADCFDVKPSAALGGSRLSPESRDRLQLLSRRSRHRIEDTMKVVALLVTQALWTELVTAAAAARPREICGALFGGAPGKVSLSASLENVSPDPTRGFAVDPGEAVRVLKAYEARALTLCGWYHSHPDGPATPSRRDVAEALWAEPTLILDAANQVGRAWLLSGQSSPKEVTVLVIGTCARWRRLHSRHGVR